MVSRLFGKFKAPCKTPTATLADCYASTEDRGEKIDKKIAKLDEDLLGMQKKMRGMREGPAKQAIRQRALRLLQQRKMYENQRTNLTQQAFNMDQAMYTTGMLKDTKVTVEAMRAGVRDMKKDMKIMDVDTVADLQDEMSEMVDMAQEIQDELGRDYNMPLVDDAELDAELEALGDELIADTDTSYLDAALLTPGVPSTVPGEMSLVPGVQSPPAPPGACINPCGPGQVSSTGKQLDEFGLPIVR